jgi:hypothetical protein
VDSFTILKLRYEETVTIINAGRIIKINNIISKQITEEEKSIIATLDPNYSAIHINKGNYELTELLQLLAQNVTSFTKPYASVEHPRIGKYLRTRSVKYKHLLEITTLGGKGKGQPKGHPNKKQNFQSTSQRAWAYLEEPTTPHLFTSTPYPKGKGTGKGKSKGGKGKGFGKGLGKGKPLFTPNGKGKGKGKQKGKTKGGKGNEPPKEIRLYEDLHRDFRHLTRKPQVHQWFHPSSAIAVTP